MLVYQREANGSCGSSLWSKLWFKPVVEADCDVTYRLTGHVFILDEHTGLEFEASRQGLSQDSFIISNTPPTSMQSRAISFSCSMQKLDAISVVFHSS